MTAPLVCVECERKVSRTRPRLAEAYLVDLDDDGADEIVLYRPLCAVREFNGYRQSGGN